MSSFSILCRAVRAACLAALPVAGFSAPAHAAGIFVPASSCQPLMNGSGQHHLHQTQFGAHNAGTEMFHVVCPVVRPTGLNGLTVSVSGAVAAGATMACTLNSNVSDGALSSLKSFSVTAAAGAALTPFNRYFSLDASDTPYSSFQNVTCSLPPNYKGRLRGLLVVAN